MSAVRRWWPWLLGVVAVVAVAGLAIGLLPRLGLVTPAASPAATPAPAPVGAAGGACPTAPEAYVGSMTPLTISAGAVSLRWCTLPDPGGFLSVYAPPDVVTLGVDRWVSAFNALKPVGPDLACRADYSTPMLALVGHADGTVQAVAGMDAGCRTIGGRLGFVEMKRLAIELITAQRGAAYEPPTVSFTPCSASSSVIPAEPATITSGAICDRTGQSPARHLDPAAIPQLRADLAAHLVPSGPEIADGPVLQLYQDNGELIALTYVTVASRWQLVRYGTDRSQPAEYFTWTPNAASQAAIEAAR